MNYENFVGAVGNIALKYQQMNPDMYVSVNRTDYGLELFCMPNEQIRKQWVDQMLTEYSKEFEDWSEVILCDKNRKIMVVKFDDHWGDCCGYSISKCSPADAFDEDTGMAVAFAHFRDYPIPDYI